MPQDLATMIRTAADYDVTTPTTPFSLASTHARREVENTDSILQSLGDVVLGQYRLELFAQKLADVRFPTVTTEPLDT